MRQGHVGVDTGGTFTDLVGGDGTILKVPSTPADPAAAVRDGIDRVVGAAGRAGALAHGTTVATNALLERAGAPVALLTSAGVGDVIEIARQDRPSLYDPWIDRPVPLVPAEARHELDERVAADGRVVAALRTESLESLDIEQHSVAVCLLHADLYPEHEAAVAEVLQRRGHSVCVSHEVSPEFREYERTVTTVINATLQPVCAPYLRSLDNLADEVTVMTSSGGRVSVETAAELPVTLLLSGPAGGVTAAAEVAAACGFPDAVSFDMGGTSTDVCLILGGRPAPASVRDVDGWPVRVPALEVTTIGAGGGSIARIDPGGALRVGPESAGARPGPACYGHGGTAATVTDANVVLGRIPAETVFSGLGSLDLDAARRALDAAGLDPQGVIDVANEQMRAALRAVTVERGVDPSGLALVAFGGAGPLHACDLATQLDIATVIVPAAAGVLSAVGLLTAPLRRELVRSWPDPTTLDGLAGAANELARIARTALAADLESTSSDTGATGDIVVTTELDCRYRGQSHELRVPSVEEFPAVHQARNGYVPTGAPIEVTALRATAEVASPLGVHDVLTRVAARAEQTGDAATEVSGPSVVVHQDCTVWVPPGWRGQPGPLGSLVLERDA